MRAGSPLDETGKVPVLKHFVPLTLVLEHDFAEKTNGRHTVIE